MKEKKLKFFALVLAVLLVFSVFSACKPPEPDIEKITVIFDVNCPSNIVIQNEPDPVTIEKGDPVAEPDPAPSRNGYVFKGWYDNSSCQGDPFDFSTSVSEDAFTLYAKWELFVAKYTVSYNYNNHGTNSSVQVESGATITPPAVSDVADAFFEGWYLEAEGVTPYVESTTVTEDFTLYAKWTTAYTVSFNLNGGDSEAIPQQKLRSGTAPTMPQQPTRGSYVFSGWYTEAACTNPYVSGAVTQSFTLYAKWVAYTDEKFTVMFSLNGEPGTAPASQEVSSGAVISLPTAPVHTEYHFVGWYTDAEGTNAFNSNSPITADLTLYAKWARVYKATFNYNYTGAPAALVRDVYEGDALTAPSNPSRTGGYTFAGWSTTAAGLLDFVFGNAISSNIALYAQWKMTYVLEAEDLDFSKFNGSGWSGGAKGTDAIITKENGDDTRDTSGKPTASNGHYVTYLYIRDADNQPGETTTLTFIVNSDRAVEGAELYWRLSAEFFNITIFAETKPANAYEKNGKYTAELNGTSLDYGFINFSEVPGLGSEYKKGFQDFKISNVSLKQGQNVIKLITDNNTWFGGTAVAVAPLVDCIKINTYAVLSWTKVNGNY